MRQLRLLAGSVCLAACIGMAVSSTWGQAGSQGGFGDALGGGQPEGAQAVTVSAEFAAPAAGKPGQLVITAVVRQGWHIYSITQPPGGPLASKIKLTLPKGIRVGEFQASPPPKKSKDPAAFGDLVIESHEGTVAWHATLELAPGVDAAGLKIPGKLNVQACDQNGCYPPRDYAFTAVPGKGAEVPAAREGSAPPIEPAPPTAQPPVQPPAQPAEVPGSTPSGPAARLVWQPFTSVEALKKLNGKFEPAEMRAYLRGQIAGATAADIGWQVLLGFLGGLVLNIMPCVLPVIGLKLLSFLEQAGQDRRKALVLNLWYSAGLMAVFVVLAALAVSPQKLGWGQQFGSAAFTITLAAVVFAMGLSFLGVWEVPIPGFVGRGKTADLAAQEGAAGAFFKGVLTTVMATPCSAPFLFPALTWASVQRPTLTLAVFIAAGLGMASPYLVIGAFPQLLRFLPKPGAWMDTFKQIMGFVLMGTVVFIFTFLDTPLLVPTLGLLFGLWAACWWIGRISPLADPGTKVRGWLEAVAFAVVVWIFMFPGVNRIYSGPYSFGSLTSLMRERYELETAGPSTVAETRPGGGDKTIFLDFTAKWCLTCQAFEANVLNTAPVVDLVHRNRVVTVRCDATTSPPEVMKMLELVNPAIQVPTLVVMPADHPNQPIVFGGAYMQQTVLDALTKAGPSR